MALSAELLAPIPGANPSGADLRYDPVYEKIKEARREDDDAPQGEWARARKIADWPLVIKLSTDAIAKKSKDLQLGAWLTEAWLRREGFGGLTNGLDLLRGLLDQFWDTLHPELEEGDAELRAAPLSWVGSKLDVATQLVPVAKGTFGVIAYRESRQVGYENPEAESDAVERRKEQIEQGKVTGELFDAAFASTPKAWYKQNAQDVAGALVALEALDEIGRARFGNDAPGFGTLRSAIEDVQRVIGQLLSKKLELEPDPPEEVAAAAAAMAAASPFAGAVAGGGISAEPVDRADAAARAVAAARFIRRANPTDPTAYLILRALRWGELRASGSPPDPRVLDAPPGAARAQLRALLLDAKWPELLEAAETLMGTSAGRGWLDIQRYALTACEALGTDYERVATALRDELKLVLAAVPTLPEMSLMDDLPTANPETRAWLAQFASDASPAAVESGAAASAQRQSSSANGEGRDKVFERASSEARAGNPQKAMELLKRELEREQSRRGRWLRQGQLASIMVESGLSQVAAPILEELVLSIEAHKLEEWESSEIVAQPLTLLYRCLEKLDGDATRRQELYLRICRLDPMAAIGFGQQ